MIQPHKVLQKKIGLKYFDKTPEKCKHKADENSNLTLQTRLQDIKKAIKALRKAHKVEKEL